jgi:hypothetical protein
MIGLHALSTFSAAPCTCLLRRHAPSIAPLGKRRLPGLRHPPGSGSGRRAARTAVEPLAARAAAAKAAAAAAAAAATQQQTLVSQLFAASTVYAMGVAAMVRLRLGVQLPLLLVNAHRPVQQAACVCSAWLEEAPPACTAAAAATAAVSGSKSPEMLSCRCRCRRWCCYQSGLSRGAWSAPRWCWPLWDLCMACCSSGLGSPTA